VCNALELRRELTPGITEWAEDLKKFAAVFPARRELEDQARSRLRGSLT
jgi:hypothetical protein